VKENEGEMASAGTGTRKEKTEMQITVSCESEAKVAALVERLNLEFEQGRVTRKDLASYLLIRGCDGFTDDDSVELKRRTLTDVSLLEFALRQARETGQIGEELRSLLWKGVNAPRVEKRAKKTRRNNRINDAALGENGS
jgi:hypothetical protein